MIKKLTLVTVLLSLASLAFVYFSHSYGPHDQYPDSKHYYKMVKNPMDINAAPAPFVYRQFTTFLTSLSIKATSNSANKINDKSIYTHLFLTNLFGIFLTMILLSYYILDHLKIVDIPTVILAPILLFLSYKVMHQAIGNLTEAWSYLFLALVYILFKKKKLILMSICLIFSLFVKEIVALISMIFFASILLITFLKHEKLNKKTFIAFVSSFLVFLSYFLIRKYWIVVAGFENQISLSTYPQQFLEFLFNFKLNPFFKLILHQNTLLILIILLIYQKGYTYLIQSKEVLACLLSVILLIVLCAGTGIMYNDISRIISSLTPICIMVFWRRIFVND